MGPERSRLARIREIYDQIADLQGAARERRLAELCADDKALRAELEELLGQDRNTILDRLDGMAASLGHHGRPRQIGPYTILDVLGRGGMGVVYRARQSEPIQREVALKLLHVRAGEELLRRFDAERQTLARMDHPNIAKVLDAGSTEDAEPFIVMELVEGEAIDRYCDDRRLGVHERIQLLIAACQGAQHAHQKGIIHRDLKPSNLLVTESPAGPRLRIIDFGIARVESEIEDAHTLLTQQGQVLGTLEYMSPEQAQGDVATIDVRTDVYSLGVVLYRLLTGRLPYELQGMTLVERTRVIASQAPDPLTFRDSTDRVDPDLEMIVSKALQKEPELRYVSCAEFGADLERFLNDLPITARPPSTIYQLKKLVRRHRLAASLMTLMLLIVLGFGAGMAMLADGQRRALRTADLERRRSEQVNAFLQDMLASADPAKSGREVTVHEALDAASKRIRTSLALDPEVLAALQQTMGTTYRGLGDYEASEQHLRSALEQLGPGAPLEQRSELNLELAKTQLVRGDFDAARTQIEAAQNGLQASPEFKDLLARSVSLQAAVEWESASKAGMDSLATLAMDLHEEAGTQFTPEALRAWKALTWVTWQTGNLENYGIELEELVGLYEHILGADHPETYSLRFNQLDHWRDRNPVEAVRLAKGLRDDLLELHGSDHLAVGKAHINLAAYQMEAGLEPNGAVRNLEKGLDILSATLEADDPDLVITTGNLGFAHLIRLDFVAADAMFRKAIALASERPGTAFWSKINLSWSLLFQSRHSDAHEILDSFNEKGRASAVAMIVRGWAQLGLGDTDGAERLFQEVLTSWSEKWGPTSMTLAMVHNGLAISSSASLQERLQHVQTAESFLLNGNRGLEFSWIPWRIHAIEALLPALRELGLDDQAIAYAATAEKLRRHVNDDTGG